MTTNPMQFYIVLAILSGFIFALITMLALATLKMRKRQTQAIICERDHTMKSISDEIHDNMNQMLNLASMTLQRIEPETEENKIMLQSALSIIDTTIRDMHYICKSLNTNHLRKKGFLQSVEQLIEWANLSKNADCRLEVDGKIFNLGENEKLMVFRIIQEALHNTIKHSNATYIKISLHYTPYALNVHIIDNGKGFDYPSKKGSGLGLNSMRQRAYLINAALRIDSIVDIGTKVVLRLPTSKKIFNLDKRAISLRS